MYSLLGVQSVAEVVRCGRMSIWKSGDDWVSTFRNVWRRRVGTGAERFGECVEDELGLQPEWTVFRDLWRGFISGETSNPR